MGRRGEGWLLIQLILLGVILAVQRDTRMTVPPLLRYIALLALAGAMLLGLSATVALGRNLSPFPKPVEHGRLIATGPYRLVRHPIYLSLILGAAGLSLLRGSPAGIGLSLLLFAFFDLKARREERYLIAHYPEYRAYQARVKRLLPWLY